LAVGMSPAVSNPETRAARTKLARDAVLQRRVSVRAEPSCGPALAAGSSTGAASEGRVTTADILEALHRVSGLPIVADFYTRLYPPAALAVEDQPLLEALDRLAESMGMRWNEDATTRGAGGWLLFRSASFFQDRLKEVPNRLLSRWSASRREHGELTLDDLVEIAQLPDAQL